MNRPRKFTETYQQYKEHLKIANKNLRDHLKGKVIWPVEMGTYRRNNNVVNLEKKTNG